MVYDIGKDDETFEWYDVRNGKRSECRLLAGKMDVLAAPVPGSAAAAAAANGLKQTPAAAPHLQKRPGYGGDGGGGGFGGGPAHAGAPERKKKLKTASGGWRFVADPGSLLWWAVLLL